MLLELEQKRIWNEARVAAGPRYTKDINVELPIKDLFEGIARTDIIFEEIEQIKKKLIKTFNSLNNKKGLDYKNKTIKTNLKRIFNFGEKLISLADSMGKNRMANLDLKSIIKEAERLQRYFISIDRIVWEVEAKENEIQRQKAKEDNREYYGGGESEELRALKDLERSLNEFQRAIKDIGYFSKSSKARLVNEPFLLILGQAGMGKTHLVCDITKNRIERQLPLTLIVLGEKLLDIKNPLESIFKSCALGGSVDSILKRMNSAGRKKKSRSLIIVDAINEADRAGWKTGVKKLIAEIKKYPWVGLVMTCRIPFQYLSLPKNFNIITEYHQGFSENELEAMKVFFKFYDLPLPEVPLLISEFSSPLFLSCFCKTAKSIKGGRAKVSQNIKDLALGQVGMTKILEDFYIAKEQLIIKKYSSKFSQLIVQFWIWNKFGNNCLIKMMAKQMATDGRQYLRKDAVVDIIKKLSNNKYNEKKCLGIFNMLVEEGVLISDASWDSQDGKYYDVIKFSFHKFSDHIIVRYLLDSFFDKNRIEESLSADNPLGKLFHDQHSMLNNIDLIEALMVEFPERIKKNAKLKEKDMIDYFPEDIKLLPQIRSAFIQSLYWRKPDNFLNNKQGIKKSIIDYINSTLLRYDDSSKEMLDLFVSTATKPFHPLSAKKLNKYLSGFTLQNRDLFWSEYLRKQYGSGSVYKLLSWIEEQNLEKITAEQARCVIIILGWVLTSNVRLLRNRATRCIFIVGKIHPEVMFREVIDLCNVNDPYLPERMLAAGYGVVMSLHSAQKKDDLLKALYPFAKKIYSLFFKKGAKFGTTNILIRDPARGIIEFALMQNNKLLSSKQKKRIRPPYGDGGIRRWGRSKDKNAKEYRDDNSPLGMDFENYTIGRLVPSRNNYDYENKGFIQVKENILWRIYQLGYSLEKFGGIDKSIVASSRLDRDSDYAGKVDRYGKKYSWIAYHELLGLKIDRNDVDLWLSEDGRSSEPDIDPSFPQTTRDKLKLSIQKNLTRGPRNIKKWMVQPEPPDISNYFELDCIDGIKDNWVLVHGTIGQKNSELKRKITTFVTGFLVDAKDTKEIKKHYNRTLFPGSDFIPSLPETRGVFAGELGWREREGKEDRLNIKIKIGEKKIKLKKKDNLVYDISILLGMVNEIKKIKTLSAPKYRIEPVYKAIPVEPLARWYYAKDYSYLGSDEDGIGLYVPSKKFINTNKLHAEIVSFNLSDKQNKTVSISKVNGDQYGTHENLLYLRKDVLEKYLKKSNKKLLLIAWGERQYWPEGGFERRKDLSLIYEKYQNVYKEIIEYKEVKK